MSAGWSLWVVVLIIINLSIASILLLWGTRVEIPTKPDGTTGHLWAHGVLREAVRKLPTWWYLMSIILFITAIAYLYFYPGFGNRKGSLGWTSVQELTQSVEKNNEHYLPLLKRVNEKSVAELQGDTEVKEVAKVLFQDNCAACHGLQGEGNVKFGAPNLRDDVWLYGGSEQAILTSIKEGRGGFMPAWKQLGYGRIKNLAHYVRSLSGLPHGSAEAKVAKDDFIENCAACHGNEGKGNPLLGAPDLSDADWLYGSELEVLEKTIKNGRHGVMPAWKDRLSPEQIKMIMVWITSDQDETK